MTVSVCVCVQVCMCKCDGLLRTLNGDECVRDERETAGDVVRLGDAHERRGRGGQRVVPKVERGHDLSMGRGEREEVGYGFERAVPGREEEWCGDEWTV